LKAFPARFFSFEGWSGECVGAAPECIVAVDRTTMASATFARLPAYVRLTVGGPGTVVTDPPGLTCGAADNKCTGRIGQGATVRLSATPPGALAAWGGACAGSGLGTCTFVAGAETEVSAGFRHAASAPGSHPLTVSLARRGEVTSDPPGIDCPPVCSASFPAGTLVTLRTPVPYQWGRACVGTGAICILVVDAPLDVVAIRPPSAARGQVGLNVSVSGRGVVTGEKIRCGGATGTLLDCAALFDEGTTVVLRAVPPTHGRFHGWSGFCAGKDPLCTVVVSAPKTVIAVFRR
jgi:hypothetical protein